MKDKQILNVILETKHYEMLIEAQNFTRTELGKRVSLAELIRKAVEEKYGVPRA